MVLVIFSCIFWQIVVLQGWQMAMLLDQQMSIFPVWQMAIYPIWQMQILPNCLYVVAHGSSKTTVCVEGMHKSCAALTLHTGVLFKTFAIKSWRNPARHIFSWLPGEAVGLHTGVLTETFAMSVLYLKSELNCGLGTINGEDASKAGAMEVKGLASRWACAAYSSHASRRASTLEYSSHASRLVKHSSTCPHGTS